MDKETLERVAKAAHLALDGDEPERYLEDLSGIVEQLDILDEVPGDGEYSVNPIEVADVLRDDVSGIFVDPYELLKNMKTYDNYVRGPRLL